MILDLQNILVYLIVLGALLFLVKKFILTKKKRNSAGCASDCGC